MCLFLTMAYNYSCDFLYHVLSSLEEGERSLNEISDFLNKRLRIQSLAEIRFLFVIKSMQPFQFINYETVSIM